MFEKPLVEELFWEGPERKKKNHLRGDCNSAEKGGHFDFLCYQSWVKWADVGQEVAPTQVMAVWAMGEEAIGSSVSLGMAYLCGWGCESLRGGCGSRAGLVEILNYVPVQQVYDQVQADCPLLLLFLPLHCFLLFYSSLPLGPSRCVSWACTWPRSCVR